MKDIQFQSLDYKTSEIEHKYGTKIHIMKDPYLLTLLAKISNEKTIQPVFTSYIEKAYQGLFNHISNGQFDRKVESIETRMKSTHPEGQYNGEVFDSSQEFVVVDLARAGIVPSQLIYNELNYLFNPQQVRQDHFYVARKTNENNEVIGIDISGSKVGGDVDNKIVIFPDPMGATGGSISESIKHYKENIVGTPKKIITAHLIITPEYVKRIKKDHPDVEVYAIRLDRGLSSKKALDSIPGTHIAEEKGLNDHQYIVPGAGGVGELLNNSYV
ncbi:MAG: hypothetical protein N4A33_07755 [Bacteriovoracaceae bacterium]|jgi:uracil phosphoribosyltransferase|nr:hypothetical protein [Bacteriovoracaceae bacterium]